jgi:FliI/YscN family ATPase
VRVQAALTATAIAEYFRDRGKDVLLMMDSLTRFAWAQREIGLAAGEPPATRGYPPSVFALLPKLVERSGRSPLGSITAFFTVLVEADDPNEPISDAVRGLLDGHAWLSRRLASRGHYPAVDVLESLSRLMPDVTAPEHHQAATAVRELMAAYRDHEDLISVGAYRRGANRIVDVAIEMQDDMNHFLRQAVGQPSSYQATCEGLLKLHQQYTQRMRGERPAPTPTPAPASRPAATA